MEPRRVYTRWPEGFIARQVVNGSHHSLLVRAIQLS